jgi:hypothetical protein
MAARACATRRMGVVRASAVVLVCAAMLATPEAAKTDIKIDADKAFSFAGLRTWAWHPDGAGDVKTAISANTDTKRIASRVEPVLVPMIEREMQARGFTKTTGQADLHVHYYVLATVGQSSQYMGQFLAPVPEWGVPPFAPVTTALEIYPVGTLIIDLTSPVKGAIVWRGSAQRKIDIERPDEERRGVLERAVRDLIKKVPQPGK